MGYRSDKNKSSFVRIGHHFGLENDLDSMIIYPFYFECYIVYFCFYMYVNYWKNCYIDSFVQL